MAEVGQATTRRTRTGVNYASQWNHFVAWSRASGKCSLPASPEDVAAYLEDRSETGARPSTLRVVAAAIARNHKDAGFDVPIHRGAARTALEELTQEDSPRPARALPLDMDCYLAIRKTAHSPRWGRGGRLERAPSARRRGAMDIAMIGLMRDARLRVAGADETGYREVSADAMKLLLPVRRGAGDDEPVCGTPSSAEKSRSSEKR